MVLAEVSPSGDGGVAVGTDADAEKIEKLLRSERGGTRLTAVGIVDEKIGDVAFELAEDIPFAALEQRLLHPDGWEALAGTLLGEPSARAGYLIKRDLLKTWWQDATPEQPPTKAGAPTRSAGASVVASSQPATKPAAILSAKYATELEGQGLDEPGALALSITLEIGGVVSAEEALALDGAKYGTSPGLVSKVRKMREDGASLCQALKGGRRAVLEHCRRLEQDYIERGMQTEASLMLSLRSGLMEFNDEKILLTYFQRYLRKYSGRGLPSLPVDKELRDDVFREQEKSTESLKKEIEDIGKRLAKAEAVAAEAKAKAAAAEEAAKRTGKSNVKTCYWCGEEGHVKPDCPVFKADLPKVKKGN
ncbi:hypothetical protein EMIHUDRAFT_95665 [Emiliania huxleyi CCMP1516]|jgi:hypothetical protein|nr:hypothetical protein EMIHUDRAFT_95665 [Emiliania huxleyi CCMP1516]EOD23079.1 hypothetical protein EMIHUDRAFT_95665 [Emiliania huxleyi CCMP1516]|eukprot:XP_005775508.1 hypothetical protein EMIHUDRAFT_95665 [Emiliania huxleyi CCMP1516]